METAVLFENGCHGDDRFIRIKDGDRLIVGVFDGVSAALGSVASEEASRAMEQQRPSTLEGLVEALRNVHEWLARVYGGDAQTTAALALITPEDLFVCTVGDSPVYLIRDGKADVVTPMDSVPEEPHVLVQAVGVGDIRIHTAQFQPKGALLLCSDGISDNLAGHEIAGIAGTARSMKRRLAALLQRRAIEDSGETYGCFKDDDRTAVIVTF